MNNSKSYRQERKNDFAWQEIECLGYVVKNDGSRPHMKKIKAIQEWKRPLNQKWLESFFSLANY